VTGEGALIGVGNGDPNCQESDKEPKRSLFNGLAQVIVQSSRTPGTITVEAYTEPWPRPKLPSTQVTITTKKIELRPLRAFPWTSNSFPITSRRAIKAARSNPCCAALRPRAASGAARRHRLGQDLYHGQGHRGSRTARRW
jgi:hypothetical protein